LLKRPKDLLMALKTNIRDLRFNLFEFLDMNSLFYTTRHKGLTQDMAEMVLGEADKVAKGVMAPINKTGDEAGAQFSAGRVQLPKGFKEAWARIAEGGWLGLSGSPDYGGQGLPISLKVAVDELFLSANTSLALTCGLSPSAASVIEGFGSDELKDTYLEKIYSGVWAASMCLTEPGAGSALASVRTRAEKIAGSEDRYLITGEKLFITAGEHDLTENIAHLVLARVPDAPVGTRGISLFVVPKMRPDPDGFLHEPNDVTCQRIEHKMGIKASPTCSLTFGDKGECEGVIIGQENKGLMYMFRMMNEERINVGVQGAALASAAYFYTLDYCKERLQSPHWTRMRDREAPNVAIVEHPDVRRMLMWQKSHVEGMRALLLTTAYYADLSYSLEFETERARYDGLVQLLTPVCKAFCTDRGFESTIMAVQCLGGYGYTSEYDVEQYARDAKIGSIYEGTNAIQSMDFLLRKIPMNGGEALQAYMTIITQDLERFAQVDDMALYVEQVFEAKKRFESVIEKLAQCRGDNGFHPLMQATKVLEMMGDICVSHLLLKQSAIAQKRLNMGFEKLGAESNEDMVKAIEGNDDLTFFYGKVKVAQFYVTQVLPGIYAKARAIESMDSSAMDVIL